MPIYSRIPPVKRLVMLLVGYKKDLTALALFGLFQGLLTLLPPLGIQAILSYLLTGVLSISIVFLILGILVGVFFAGWITIIQLSMLEAISQKVYVKGALEFWMRMPFLKGTNPGGLSLSQWSLRFFEVPTIQKSLIKLILDVSTAAFQLLLGVVLLGIYHPLLVIPGIAMVILLWIIIRVSGAVALRHAIDASTQKYNWMHWLMDKTKENRHTVQDKIDEHDAEVDSLLKGYLTFRNSQFFVMRRQWFSMLALKVIVIGLLLGFGVWLVLDGNITLGAFVAAEMVIMLILASIEKIWLSLDTVYSLLVGFEKVGKYTDQDLEDVSDVRNLEQ